jgi:hypothetical protein
LVRKASIQQGQSDWSVGATEWDIYTQNDFSFFGSHTADPCGPGCDAVSTPALSCSSTDASEAGVADGTANVIATGASGSYSYLWDSGETTSSISALPAGDYCVTVTDSASGCDTTCCVTVSEPQGCPAMQNLLISAQATTATFSWVPEPLAGIGTQIQYRIPPGLGGGGNGTAIAAPGSASKSVLGLTPGIQHQSRTRHFCSPGNAGPWKFKPFVTSPLRMGNSNLFEIYPNPASEQVTMVFEVNWKKDVQITVTDLLGRQVKTLSYEAVSGNNFVTLEINQLSNGFYLVKIEDGNTERVKKLIVEN